MAVGSRRISIKWKLFFVVAVLISGAVLVIVSRTTSIFREDKEAFVKELSAKLASSTSKNILNRITTLQDKLVIFISSRESLAHTGAKADDQVQVLFSRYQEFISIGFVSTDEAGKLHPEWVMRNPQGPAVKWPADYEKSFLSTLNLSQAKSNERAFWRTQGPDGTWYSVLGFSVQVLDVKQARAQQNAKAAATAGAEPQTKTVWIVGVLPSGAFDDLLNDFSTGLNAGFVVDDQGVAIANSDPEGRWKNMKTHPLVAEALKGDRTGETTDSKDSDGRAIIGSFEYIPKINLVAVVTTPRDKAFEAADVMSRDIYIIGLLILFVALSSAIILSNYLTGPIQKLASIAAKIGAGDFKTPVDVTTNDEIGELADSFKIMEAGLMERDEKIASAQTALVQSEKMSAFGQLSAGIAHEVKNPLAGILGHAQLAIGKIKNEDVKKHLEVIEKETRRCKQIVENLMKFARAEKATLVPTDLAQAAQDTINLVDHQLTLAGCKIYKDFQPCPMVEANANMLQQVLLNLMVNASHAMETCPNKNVTVRVVQAGRKAQIQVEDTGTGIPPEVQKKMFEPFFTTKPAGKGTGLGLSVSIGIVKDHKGEIYIKSEMGKGTTFFIDIPIAEGAQMPTKPLENTHGGVQVKESHFTVGSPPGGDGPPVTAAAVNAAGSSAHDAKPGTTAPAAAAKVPPVSGPLPAAATPTMAAKLTKDAPIPKNTGGTAGGTISGTTMATVPAGNVVNLKDSKKGDLPKGLPRVSDLGGTFKRPASNDPTPPPPADAENPGIPSMSKVDLTFTKAAAKDGAKENGKEKSKDTNKDQSARAAVKPMASIPKSDISELGGKKPVDVTQVNLPKHPEELEILDVTIDDVAAANTQNHTMISAAVESTQTISGQTMTQAPSEATRSSPGVVEMPAKKERTGEGAEEFKVKIKRPKLKG